MKLPAEMTLAEITDRIHEIDLLGRPEIPPLQSTTEGRRLMFAAVDAIREWDGENPDLARERAELNAERRRRFEEAAAAVRDGMQRLHLRSVP